MTEKLLKKEWLRLLKQENLYIKKNSSKPPSRLDEMLTEKLPEKAITALETAFAKSLLLALTKGTSTIEKSYKKDEIVLRHKLNLYALDLKEDKKRIKAFEKGAKSAKFGNVLLSGVKGLGLGVLGIGLPDIPLCIGMMLKGVYEIAINYGYEYDSDVEQCFILGVMHAAFSGGDDVSENNNLVNGFIDLPLLPDNYSKDEQVAAVAQTLATSLFSMKFIQGIPIVGAVGGVADSVYIDKLLSYAELKYRRRFLAEQLQMFSEEKKTTDKE